MVPESAQCHNRRGPHVGRLAHKGVPRFYVDSDFGAADELHKLFNALETQALSGSSGGEQNLLPLICKFGSQYGKDGALLSQKAIQVRIEALKANPKEDRQMFVLLNQLVEACKMVSCDEPGTEGHDR